MQGKTVTVTRFNCREFRTVRWHDPEVRAELGCAAVIVTTAVAEHVRPGVIRGAFTGRREVGTRTA
jgi:hypothetical protein